MGTAAARRSAAHLSTVADDLIGEDVGGIRGISRNVDGLHVPLHNAEDDPWKHFDPIVPLRLRITGAENSERARGLAEGLGMWLTIPLASSSQLSW